MAASLHLLSFNYSRFTNSPASARVAALKSRPFTVRSMSDTASTKVVPAVIVGGGRVGRALQELGGGSDLLVRRGEPVPVDFEGPILVCTRNDDLEAVLEATPRSRWTGTALALCIVQILCSCLVLSLWNLIKLC